MRRQAGDPTATALTLEALLEVKLDKEAVKVLKDYSAPIKIAFRYYVLSGVSSDVERASNPNSIRITQLVEFVKAIKEFVPIRHAVCHVVTTDGRILTRGRAGGQYTKYGNGGGKRKGPRM